VKAGTASSQLPDEELKGRVTDNKCLSVGVVIPTYDRDDLLEACLKHLACQTFRSFRTIIVDNGARSAIPQFLRGHDNVQWIPMSTNHGTAVAFNRGIRAAQDCNYVFLLNNDAEMEPDCLLHLVHTLETESGYSVAVPKILRWSDPHYLDGAGDEILLGGGAYRVGNGELDAGQYDVQQPVFSACAAAALYRMDLFEDIGYFDEDFFAYQEDVDLCLRAHLRGHRCIYVPSAHVRHHGSATMGTPTNSRIIRLATRNQVLAILKTYPGSTLLRLLPQIFVFQLLWLGFAARKNAMPGYCLGVIDLLRALPRTLAKRAAVQSTRRLDGQAFLRLLEDSEGRIWYTYKRNQSFQPSRLLGTYFRLFKPPLRARAVYGENP
jgi:GT2 family glycosyltransferase